MHESLTNEAIDQPAAEVEVMEATEMRKMVMYVVRGDAIELQNGSTIMSATDTIRLYNRTVIELVYANA